MMLKNQRLRSGTKEVGSLILYTYAYFTRSYTIDEKKSGFKSEKVGIYWGAI